MTDFARRWCAKTRERIVRATARLKARARSGSAAVEFAFVAPVFFILFMGTIEVGIMFFSQFVLQNATNNAARLIRTGQVASQAMTADQFRTQVCNQITPLLSCNANLQIDVEAFNSFSGATYTNPMTNQNTLNPNLNNWQPGNVCSVVLVRVFYTWQVITPLLTPFMTNMANDQHLLSATAAFRNEPYTSGVAGC